MLHRRWSLRPRTGKVSKLTSDFAASDKIALISFLLTKKGGKDVPKGVPPLGIPPFVPRVLRSLRSPAHSGTSYAARHIVNRKAVDAENFPAENFLRLISLRNVPAGWSHQRSAGHRDILGRILLRGAGVPFTTLTSTQRRPTTPSLSLFAKFSPVIEVAKFSKSAASGLEMTSIRGDR